MRKLASIKRINSIAPIEGADAIECAHVGGWPVVVKKGEFTPGDLAVYFEIDSWVPNEIAPFLTKDNLPRQYNGVPGERLRTVKLRGQLSQGLLLPLSILPEGNWWELEGTDVTDLLNVQKWEAPETFLDADSKGNFPRFISKTDQERCQNLVPEIFGKWSSMEWEVSMKLDGSSMTIYHNEGTVGVCSRNLEKKLEFEDSSFIKTAMKTGLLESLPALGRNLAVQGEIMGPGIQGNREGLRHFEFFAFDVFDIDTQKYLGSKEREELAKSLRVLHVPILERNATLSTLNIRNIDDLLLYADGPSLKASLREGVVFKEVSGSCSFKAISNKFLLKSK
jgi:RNA ligase (TIGR02306 family)